MMKTLLLLVLTLTSHLHAEERTIAGIHFKDLREEKHAGFAREPLGGDFNFIISKTGDGLKLSINSDQSLIFSDNKRRLELTLPKKCYIDSATPADGHIYLMIWKHGEASGASPYCLTEVVWGDIIEWNNRRVNYTDEGLMVFRLLQKEDPDHLAKGSNVEVRLGVKKFTRHEGLINCSQLGIIPPNSPNFPVVIKK